MSKLSVPAALKRAEAHVKSGEISEAQRIYSAVLKARPNHPKALRSLKQIGGMNGHSSSEPTEAEVRKIGDMYKGGDMDGALKRTRKMLQTFPNSAHLWNFVGVINNALGNRSEAVDAMQRVTELNPSSPEAFLNLGNGLRAERRYREAADALEKAVALRPNYAFAFNTLGNVLSDIADYDKAVVAYKKALKLKPNYSNALFNLSLALTQQEDIDDAVSYARLCVEASPTTPDGYAGLGEAELARGNHDAAIEWFEKALSKDEQNLTAKLALGRAHVDGRNKNSAEEIYREVLARNPRHAGAYNQLAALKKFTDIDDDVIAMENLRAELGDQRNMEDHEQINFALAKVYRDVGDYEQSFARIKQGNDLLLERIDYDLEEDVSLFARIKETAPKLKPVEVAERPPVLPIFIVGMPRSGTSLTEQILSSHSQVSAGGELGYAAKFGEQIADGTVDATPENILKFRQKYLERIEKLSDGLPFVSDKMPHNFRFVGLLNAAFPDAKIVRMRRDARAVAWSNFWQYFARRKLGYSFSLDATVEFYHMFEDLMAFWHEQLPGRVWDFDYDLLTEDQEVQTRRFLEALDLPWEDACLSPHKNRRAVRTASKLQVTKPVYKASSAEWQKFEPFIGCAFDSLAQYQSS